MTSKIGNRTITNNFGLIGQVPRADGLKTFNVTHASNKRTAFVSACFAVDAAGARAYFERVQPETEVLAVELAGTYA